MTSFARGRKPDASKSSKKPPDNQPSDAAKKQALLQLQKTLGNKAVIQMIMQQPNDTRSLKPQDLGLHMLDQFPLTAEPRILNGYSLLYEQLHAYTGIIGGYKHYVDMMLSGNALALFYQYKDGFLKGIQRLLKNTLIPNVETLLMLLRQTESGEPEEEDKAGVDSDKDKDTRPEDDKDRQAQRIKLLEELKRSLEQRLDGLDIRQIEQRVPKINLPELKSPGMQSFQKEVLSGAVFAMGEDQYFQMFLRKNKIDPALFARMVQLDDAQNESGDTAADRADRLRKWEETRQRLLAGS
ncbi:MAG: hypothetical protein MUE40_07020 [Anaerolineae bacterium]|nr:hypothetical protein [Anaerolineae bacterium]